jgi:uncharacterized OB-fold protein
MTTLAPKSASNSVLIAENGEPWVRSFRCDACGAVMPERTMACRACGARDTMAPVRSATSGKLWSWTVVHRSYPGVAVPFVSAIVDLDGGLSLKGTVKGVEQSDLHAGLPVTLVFDDAGGALDKDGTPYVGYHFVATGG